MERGNQLKLLLWKDGLVRKRHLGVASLVFGWAIAVFLILFIVRESIDPEYSPTCQYTARSLPSTGLFPFVQSFICNVDNKCNNINQYEEVPQYSNARLTGVAKQLETAFTNETIAKVVKSLPDMLLLLKTVGRGLDSPDLVGIFGPGIKIGNLFDNTEQLKRDIIQNNPKLDVENLDDVFNSNLKLGHLLSAFGDTDLQSEICNPNQLEKYLILPENGDIEAVSKNLCNIEGSDVPNLLQSVFDNADFSGLLAMIGNVAENFSNYNVLDDVKKVVEIILNLNSVKENIPESLKLKSWLPDIITEMKFMNRTHLDANFVDRSLKIIEPHFKDTSLWTYYKTLVQNITSLLLNLQNKILDKGLVIRNVESGPSNFSDFVNHLQKNIESYQHPTETDLIKKQNLMFTMLSDALDVIPAFYSNGTQSWIYIANILDSLKPIVNNEILNSISMISNIFSKAVTSLFNTIKGEHESEQILYDLCQKHSNTVSTLFSLGPDFISSMLNCFENITCTSIIVENQKNMPKIFCDKDMIEYILPEASSIKNIGILCNFDLGSFIDDLNIEFNLDWINKTIPDMQEVNKYTTDSNTSFYDAVKNTETFVKYILERPKMMDEKLQISWEQLLPDIENMEWKSLIEKAKKNTGLYMVNIQLSYVKYFLLKEEKLFPLFNATTSLMEGLITQYQLIPKQLIKHVIHNLPSIIENILRVFTDKTQIIALASIDDWEDYFCNQSVFLKEDNLNQISKIICEQVTFFKTQSQRSWFEHPLTATLYDVIKNYPNNTEFDTKRFEENGQQLYFLISDLLDTQWPVYNWDGEVFTSDYWVKWAKKFDFETAMHFSIQILAKIADDFERSFYPVMPQENLYKIKRVSSSAYKFIIFVFDNIDFALDINNNSTDSEIIFPKTYHLSQMIIKNLDSLIIDFNKYGEAENSQVLQVKEWLEQPCTKDVELVFEKASVESKTTLLAIHNFICNPDEYSEEWKNQEDADKTWDSIPWNKITSRFTKLIHDLPKSQQKNNTISEDEKEINVIHNAVLFEKSIFKILDKYIEDKLMRKDTLHQLWIQLIKCKKNAENCSDLELDVAKYTSKFIASGVSVFTNRITDYIKIINNTKGVDPLRLLGFKNTSAIYKIYLKFPDYIKVFVNSYRSPEFERKIFEKRSVGNPVSCNDILSNLEIPENNAVTKEDINDLKKYLCPSIFEWPVMRDNIFLSTISEIQDIYLETPVAKYKPSFVEMSQNLFDFKITVIDMFKYGNVNVTELWNNIWTDDMKNTFEDIKELPFNTNNTIARYFKYIHKPYDKYMLSVYLINPKYGFGDFAYLIKQINFMLSNYTSSNSTNSEAKELKNLIEVYQKEITSIFSYIYIKFAKEGIVAGFNEFCNSSSDVPDPNMFMPNWMLKDDGKIDKLCKYAKDDFKDSLASIEKLDIKNYNVVLEEIILQFLTTLNNFANNKNEINISRFIKDHLDLEYISKNMSFPTDEELRNSSLEKAHEIVISNKYTQNVVNVDETLKITSSLLKVLQGGDWWDSLLKNIEDPLITFWLRLLEKAPQIILNMADAAISPHLLFDITSKVVTQGPMALCDNKIFEINRYIREENIVSIVHEFCNLQTKIDDKRPKLVDIQANGTFYDAVINENVLANDIEDLQKSLIQLVKEGNKPFIMPKWMEEKEILKEYTNYATRNKNPLKLLQTVTTIINEIIDIGSVFYKNETNNCSWCTWSTILVREANEHLSKAQKYAEFLCEIPKMNFTQIRVALVEEFKWGALFRDLTGNLSYTVEDFNREIHDIVEVIRVQLITFYTNKTLQNLPQKCLKDIAETPALKNITTYISAVREIISTIKSSSVTFLNSSMFEYFSKNISEAIEENIPILKPFTEVLDASVAEKLIDVNINNETVVKLLNSKVDINTLSKVQNEEDIKALLTDKIMFHKLFTFEDLMYSSEIYLDVNNENTSAVSGVIFMSLNRSITGEKIKAWREDEMKSLNWVTNIFENLEHVVFNGGSLLEFIANVDVNSLTSGHINISEMLKGVLDLLNKNSIEKLFQSLKDLVKSSAPLIQNEVIVNDLYNMLEGLEDLDIFKNLGLLRIKYNVSKVVENWPEANSYLTNQIHLEKDAVNDILNASIDLSQILSSQGDGLNIQEMFCSPEELSKLIKFNTENPQKTAQKLSNALCNNITISEIQNIAVLSFKNINITKVLEMIMETTVTTILTSANMTEEEGKEVIDNIGLGAGLLPYLRTMIANVSKDFSMLSFDSFKSEEVATEVISPDLLATASNLLCGRPLVQNTNKLYQAISETKDYNADKYDDLEQMTLPGEFCRNLYKDIIHMPAGKVIWAYIKPLIRGKILYTPNIPVVENILENANTTFKSISDFQDILVRITDALETLEDRKELEHIIDNIENFMNSSMVQMAVRSMLKSVTNQEISFSDFNLKNMLNSFGDSDKMSSALKFGRDFLQCVLLNRFIGMESEEELEEEAKRLMETNEFIAGIVFTDLDNRNKRSTDELPRDISYKIRMDIDSVPSTNYLKYKFWTPGPENDFLDELRYFRGFIQLQDLIDNSIIKLRSPIDLPKWDTLTQEMPYSCYTRDFFKSALTISQTFQVCFFFGLIAVVAAAVRYIVWEKESGNTMIMNVMGLKYITHCISWFLVTLFEMLFVMICILIILKAGGIIVMSDTLILFLYLIDFGFALIMFCYMISSLFNSASLAAVGSAIFYLLSFMPYIIIISLETSLPFWAKMLTNLSMSTSFCYGCLYLIRFELQGVGIQWSNAWETPVPGDTMSFGMTCIFLLFDGILYGVIGYLCSRKSQEMHKMFNYLPSWFFTNTYNCGTAGSYTNFADELYMRPFMIEGENYLDETVSRTNLVNDEPLKIGVTIKSLTKVYNSRKKTVKAIEDIDITLYIGQVTTLLGHNGAGKTTLIKILTGMMQPTSGKIIINSEITEQGNETKFLGVCPQASVLIDTMSPLEHLIFYARLKTGKGRDEVMNEVVEMIDSLSLGYLSNEPVNHLSEGMRRRLCVAIAFIGKPKLVVLDEPSSGVDPVARRQIWDLVIRYKEGCTVLLTTHYLDEAEILSDRVVVLHKGKVLCSGSPLILKQSYGSGYRLTVTYPEDKQKKEINDGTLEMLMSVVNKPASNATLSEIRKCEIDVMVPFNSNEGIPNNFEAVALALEDNQYNLGFSTYSMNCSTLEEIFLDLCSRADLKQSDLSSNYDRISQLGRSYSNMFSSSVEEIPSTIKDDDILLNTGEKLTGGNVDKFFALLKKRAIHCTYDWRVIICALVLPTLFTAVAMGFSLIRPPNINEPSLKLSPELYHPHTTSFISVDNNDMTSFINRVSKEIVGISPNKNLELYTKTFRDCVCTKGMQQCQRPSNSPNDALLKLYSANETIDWLIETQNEYIEQRYGGWSLSEQATNKSAMVVWYNNKGYHSMPSYLNTMNSAILRTISPGSTITTYNHPLKLSVDQLSKSSIAQHIADVGIAMVLLIAFSLIPASGSIYLVQERVNEEKRLQFLCGVSPTLYWLVAFIWDIIVLSFALLLAVIVFKIFGLPVYTAKENMAAVSLLIFLYGWACIPFIHLAQRLFNDASMANMILFCVCTFIGISELTCLLLMDILGTTQFVADFRIVLHKIYLIFPQFVLGDGLVEISKNNIQAEILQRFHMDTYTSPLSWDLMGLHYLSLAIMGIILFTVNLMIENEWFRSFRKSTTIYPTDSSCLEIVNLIKVYNNTSGKHVAVNDINLKVPFGECLGLIGVNGAGKSTTFKMLTTELRPTSGRIFLQGREICRKPLYTGEMGYCAQCDSLDPKLTVKQTLSLYLTLRGIVKQNNIIYQIMTKFELNNYANRRTENLSGGNKRKLCTALSVLGKTSLILMDEPTSGMDPTSRNLVATTIQQLTKANRSVILTSHSVEDCEALCSDIAVMINGKIICQGSPKDLKERYGSGYIISVRLAKPSEQDLLLELMKKEFSGCELMTRQYCSSQFSVPTDKTKVSDMFKQMSKISHYVSVEDFNLVQSSLDQVFINLANRSDTSNGIEEKLPNMYSMEVI